MNLEYNKGILFVRLSGKLNHELSKKINMYLIPKILEQKIKYLVFNMYDVNYIDNFGLDALLNAKCAIKCNKGKICLCEINDKVKSMIKGFKLNSVNNEVIALKKIGNI